MLIEGGVKGGDNGVGVAVSVWKLIESIQNIEDAVKRAAVCVETGVLQEVPDIEFEKAGPRKKIFFDPGKVKRLS